MNHNIYIYILVMAGVTYLIRMLPLALSRNHQSVYQIFSVLCALCMPGSHDVSGNPFCYGQCDLGSSRICGCADRSV